jgi:hypothetical protein
MLAALQYDFPDARPAMCCLSIGLLLHLVRTGGNWQTQDEYLLETQHHTALESIRMIDLSASGTDELVVESNTGGGASGATILKIFDLRSGHFEEVYSGYSQLANEDQEGYTQTLDVDRTSKTHGSEFCFKKTLLFESGKYLVSPRATRPCYRRGATVDQKRADERNQMLKPLR